MLIFDFAGTDNIIKRQVFDQPVEVLSTDLLEEVPVILEKVQDAVDNGYYAAGYVSYEAAPAFDAALASVPSEMPLIWFGLYKQAGEAVPAADGEYTVSEWTPSIKQEKYAEAISAIKGRIENGDTYQVNYTIRLNASFKGDSLKFYHDLAAAQSARYSAYLETDDYTVISASPELFFQMKHRHITARPMKGTVKRGTTWEDDKGKAEWLAASEKNQAENVMIVDLLRNDLSKIAKKGTVKVPQLFDIEKYPTVYQMTSTVTAEVEDSAGLSDIFQALFPCGSITGAPKVKTMEIISELEEKPREVYCGAIGYLSPSGETVFNVPIRTVVVHNPTGRAEYGVGGGITWDSEAGDEYEETVAKAAVLWKKAVQFDLLESIALENGCFYLLDEHMNRIQKSADYFGFPFSVEAARQSLAEAAEAHREGLYKVRLLSSRSGLFKWDAVPIEPVKGRQKAVLAKEPVLSGNPFLYHKTTNRTVYEERKDVSSTAFDVLLWNEKGELTEFTNGNMVVEMDGCLYTPPVSCGLLGGTFRERLLTEGAIEEKVLRIEDLQVCSKVWLINSVRKWIEVEFTPEND
ncbi:aminobenzoate synthetase [Bacillus sp. FJAT-27916]|uniref:aminodeoxychorismate synthase component I n=1 Tax=Bacillus sp. FJAT-27916 TaxID=1679169 RepID=UPI000670C012|nr:aminodeoxychorismate synthase component I [Bacillus sp. FJAT-27916]KMY45689.1 aminobenzoate synthetase [Bacillus sp. FJAT-27916]